MAKYHYEDEQCITCGVWFGVPGIFQTQRRADKVSFYCPNGHSMHYTGDTPAQKIARLQREKDRLVQRIAERDDDVAAAQRQASAFKGVATRLKNRAAAGVCPCCNRSFQELARHIKSEHPGFRKAEITA